MSVMYFPSRAFAGQQLANMLMGQYAQTDSIVLCISGPGVLVGEPIARQLQLKIYLLASEDINLPGTFKERVGAVDQAGDFIYDHHLSEGERSDIFAEYHGHIDAERQQAVHKINQATGVTGFVHRELLTKKNIIIVDDGMKDPAIIDVVLNFLKPVESARIIAALPACSVEAVDRLHITTDEIKVLSVKQNYIETNHYYDDNTIPEETALQQIIQDVNLSVPMQ